MSLLITIAVGFTVVSIVIISVFLCVYTHRTRSLGAFVR